MHPNKETKTPRRNITPTIDELIVFDNPPSGDDKLEPRGDVAEPVLLQVLQRRASLPTFVPQLGQSIRERKKYNRSIELDVGSTVVEAKEGNLDLGVSH